MSLGTHPVRFCAQRVPRTLQDASVDDSALLKIDLLTPWCFCFKACWVTGGSVQKLEVYENEGGVTSYSGGCRVLVIPAGYVGAAISGGVIVAMSGGDRLGSTICACLIICFLIISLW